MAANRQILLHQSWRVELLDEAVEEQGLVISLGAKGVGERQLRTNKICLHPYRA